ncbi:MAG: histidine kinase [Cyclobacteriaceae bacterium]
MFNPITRKKSFLIAYFGFWLLIAAIQAMTVHWSLDVSWKNAIIDAAIYAILFGIAGLSIWFVVRFTGLEIRNLWNVLVNHLAAASLIIFFWLSLSYALSSALIGKSPDIREATMTDVSWRAGLGLIWYILVALNYYLLIYYQNFKEKAVSELEMKSLLKESELSMLKAQLNPHFIFNSLNSISALTLSRPEDAHEMIVKLSTFLRHTIGHSETDLISINKEIETISLYLDIEKSRFGEKLIVDIDGLDDLNDSFLVPNLILQPLVENAVKYGVYERLTTSVINIKLWTERNYLMIAISNQCGTIAKKLQGKGIGLKNVKRRLFYLYENNELIKITKEDDLFTTLLKIPQKNYDEKVTSTDH